MLTLMISSARRRHGRQGLLIANDMSANHSK
jgi:hypothetical protein